MREQHPDRQVWANPTALYVVAASDKDRMRCLSGLADRAGVGGGVLMPGLEATAAMDNGRG